MNRKVLLVPDIHGELHLLRKAIKEYESNKDKYESVIFLGDYVDSFTATDSDILLTLFDLLAFKKKYPEKVVLLWGNHDYAYYKHQMCSGRRQSMVEDLKAFFNEHNGLFKLVHTEASGSNQYLFSHAGLSQYYISTVCGFTTGSRLLLTENINSMLDSKRAFGDSRVYTVGKTSGGYSKTGGVLWLRPHEIDMYNPLINGYIQYVGHTGSNEPYTLGEGLTSLTTIDTGQIYELDLNKNKLTKIENGKLQSNAIAA